MMYSPQTVQLAQPESLEYPDDAPLGPCVMVIDDSPTVRAVVEAFLSRGGFRVVSFPDGLAAMGTLARGEVEVPQLVLIDIGLPKMDGYEVARILRSKSDFDHTVLVMLSAHDGILDRLRGRMVGASAFIAKPFKPHQVLDVVRSCLGSMLTSPGGQATEY